MKEIDLPTQSSAGDQATGQEYPVEPQILLVLVGLPGSGKTTFAEALLRSYSTEKSSRRKWTRASQDDAPSRRRQECEAVTRSGLKQGHNVIVDRVGFDAVQRSHFINIADQHQPRPLVYALYLSVSIPSLEKRLSLRTSHPTLADPKTAMMVLRDMNRQLSVPTPEAEGGEGFDKIYTLDESLQPTNGDWTEMDLQRVLGLIQSEGQAETVSRRVVETRPAATNHSRGRGFDPSRGMNGRGRGAYQGYPRGGRPGALSGGGGYSGGDVPRPDDRSWRPYPQPSQQQFAGYRNERPPYRPYSDINNSVARPHTVLPARPMPAQPESRPR